MARAIAVVLADCERQQDAWIRQIHEHSNEKITYHQTMMESRPMNIIGTGKNPYGYEYRRLQSRILDACNLSVETLEDAAIELQCDYECVVDLIYENLPEGKEKYSSFEMLELLLQMGPPPKLDDECERIVDALEKYQVYLAWAWNLAGGAHDLLNASHACDLDRVACSQLAFDALLSAQESFDHAVQLKVASSSHQPTERRN